MKLTEYYEYIKDKNVGFLGLGRSNMPLIRLLAKKGVRVTVRDKKERALLSDYVKELSDLGAKLVSGEGYLDGIEEHDVIYKTPAVRPDMPVLAAAREKGTVITSEMELFFSLCPCKIFAVTGSDGKTTTTTLIYEMLKKQGCTCHLGGNIGRPLIGDIEKIKPEDMAVVELSSFQLMGMKAAPDVAVITNLSENHLDWHVDFAEYIHAKKSIFKNQPRDGRLILNADNEYTAVMEHEAVCPVVKFSLSEKNDGVYLKDGKIYSGTEVVADKSDIILPGMHNVANYMAAIAATEGFVSHESMRAVARTFGGVEHRIEFVREKCGVSYYNDSIGSSPARTTATLNAFSDKVILIAGGYDKGLNYDALGKLISEKVKKLCLIGATSDKIERAARDNGFTEIYRAESFSDAVKHAALCAVSGDKVVLSPASASFDLFRDFDERGKTFKSLVNEL